MHKIQTNKILSESLIKILDQVPEDILSVIEFIKNNHKYLTISSSNVLL